MGITQVRRSFRWRLTSPAIGVPLAWPILDMNSGGYHKTVLVLSALSLLEFATRPSVSPYPPSLSLPSVPAASKFKKKRITDANAHAPWFLSALALGVLVFSLHERLSDFSTLIAWS